MVGRDALLDAAFAALVEHGPTFAATDVARAAGASKALLFHHFGSREGLLDAMAARVLQETQAGLERLAEDYPNPRERLAAFARTLLEHPGDTPPRAARHVMQFWWWDDADEACRATLRDALLADFVAATMREGQAMGAIRPTADARAVAATLLARWHGATALYAAGRPFDFDVEAERLASDVLAAIAPA